MRFGCGGKGYPPHTPLLTMAVLSLPLHRLDIGTPLLEAGQAAEEDEDGDEETGRQLVSGAGQEGTPCINYVVCALLHLWIAGVCLGVYFVCAAATEANLKTNSTLFAPPCGGLSHC